MAAYYEDGRGRYGTGESYDWFQKFMDEEDYEVFTSTDGLWTYDVVEEGIELLRYNGSEIHIVIPDRIDGKKVVSLDSTFDGFYELKSVVVPKGITSIIGAFYGCEGLEQVTLPEGIEDMTYAFNCCYALKQIQVPKSAKRFSWAFEGTALESFVFPQGTEEIANCFMGSECLRSVVIPKSVRDMNEAFSDCDCLEQVVIEDGVEQIDDYAFFHCLNLKEIVIPESVTTIGKQAVGFMEIREYIGADQMGYKMKGIQVVHDFTIKGVLGSEAEKYARENKITFVPIA